MGIGIFRKDIKVLWRSSLSWLVFAIISFLAAWLLWQMVDQYVVLQDQLLALPNPTNITTALLTPYIMVVAQLMLLPVAYQTAAVITQEFADRTIWYLQINQSSMFQVVWQKFKAVSLVILFALLLVVMAVWLLAVGGQLNWTWVVLGLIGLILYITWLIALGLLVASWVRSVGAAVLLNLLVFGLFWFMGGQTVAADYGVNWLHLFSPGHHLRWLASGELSVSSLLYFVLGSCLFLGLTARQLKKAMETA